MFKIIDRLPHNPSTTRRATIVTRLLDWPSEAGRLKPVVTTREETEKDCWLIRDESGADIGTVKVFKTHPKNDTRVFIPFRRGVGHDGYSSFDTAEAVLIALALIEHRDDDE